MAPKGVDNEDILEQVDDHTSVKVIQAAKSRPHRLGVTHSVKNFEDLGKIGAILHGLTVHCR